MRKEVNVEGAEAVAAFPICVFISMVVHAINER